MLELLLSRLQIKVSYMTDRKSVMPDVLMAASRTVFNKVKVDLKKQPMFFGEQGNIARYDEQHYPIFEKLTETQHGFFWRPTEIDLTRDIRDFRNMAPHERRIFTLNLCYQILMDSVNGRAPAILFMPHITVPELETCVGAWTFMEQIHSRSYSYIIRNLYSDPSEVFDTIINDPVIVERAKSVTKYLDQWYEYSNQYQTLGIGVHHITGTRLNPETGEMEQYQTVVTITEKERNRRLYMAMMAIYALEGIRFYVSFICSFAYAEQKPARMEGNAKSISLIARDEFQHMGITLNIIKIWKRDPAMREIIEECHDEVMALFDEVVSGEKAWAQYLFRDGNLLGLNVDILSKTIEFYANERMHVIGLGKPYPTKELPARWVNRWLTSGDRQVAPQETENTSYVVGGISFDEHDDAVEQDLDVEI